MLPADARAAIVEVRGSAHEQRAEVRGSAHEQRAEVRGAAHEQKGGTGPASVRPASEPSMADEAEHTRPSAFVPSRPGARRDTKAPSPGAYSQVAAPRRRRPSAPPPTPPARPAPAQSSSFDELDTSTFAALPPAPAELLQSGGTMLVDEEPLEAPRRTSSVPPMRTTIALAELPPAVVTRRDSTRPKVALPEGPVGAPHGSWVPVGTFSQEPNKSPALLDDLRGSVVMGETISRLPPPPALPSSLVPPTSAAHTVPPVSYADERRGRGLPIWLISGVLASIIVAAIAVGLRERNQQEQVRSAVAAPPVEASEPALAPAPAAPSAVAPPIPAFEPPTPPAPVKPAKATVGSRASAAAAPQPKPSVVEEREASEDEEEATPPVKRLKAKPREPERPEIPENPY
jgi:hypothetical protein